jgi:hypothetical protein
MKQRIRLNYMSQLSSINITGDKVKSILDGKRDPETNVIDQDLENQDNNFKNRLEDKRKKKNTFNTLDVFYFNIA